MSITLTRDFYTPKSSTEIRDDEDQSVAYIFDNSNGKPAALGFAGTGFRGAARRSCVVHPDRNWLKAAFFGSAASRGRVPSRLRTG